MQALPSEPESIIVLEVFGAEAHSTSTVHLNIGLQVRLPYSFHFCFSFLTVFFFLTFQ